MVSLDVRQAMALEIARRFSSAGTNVRAIMPSEDCEQDIFIVLFDGSEESFHALPEALKDMVCDSDLPDFRLKDALEMVDWARRCMNE